MTSPIGGSAITVSVVTDGRAIQGGPAIPVYAFNASTIDRPIEGGPSMAVKVVTAAELASGAYRLAGDVLPIPVYADDSQVEGGPAIPVYLIGGSL